MKSEVFTSFEDVGIWDPEDSLCVNLDLNC
jgi:hypothetical protein